MVEIMKKKNEKKNYEEPKLKRFGSVRNITGGSATMMMDGAVMMAFI